MEEESCEVDKSELEEITKRSNLFFRNSCKFENSQKHIYSINNIPNSPLNPNSKGKQFSNMSPQISVSRLERNSAENQGQ